MSVPPPPGVERQRSLKRYSTIRTGGPAELFARPVNEAELLELLAWALAAGKQVIVIGSGSNVLIADEGVEGLVLKLDGELATIVRQGETLRCGGGARLPAVAAAAARLGLSGIEFGVNIPGTVGGSVRMNANAYGGELADVLQAAWIATAEGVELRRPSELGFGYRHSTLGDGEIVLYATFELRPEDPATVKATLAKMRSDRRQAQPQGIKTFGSTFKNPSGAASLASGAPARGGAAMAGTGGTAAMTAGKLLSEAGCNGLRVGDARFAVKHANFVENLGEASTADVLALMAEGRKRVLERFGIALEPEVQMLGDVRLPWAA